MQVRRLIDNDYSFGKGQLDIIDGLEAVLQTCQTTLMQLKGEWFLDYRDGVAWGGVLGQKSNNQELASLIKRTLLSVDNVTEVTEILVENDGRYANIIAQLKTDFGDANLNKSLNVLEILANDEVN